MSSRTTAQKMARGLQRLAEDELGIRPKLTTCHNIIRSAGYSPPGTPKEVHLAQVFEAYRDVLKQSAEVREAQKHAHANDGGSR